MRRQRERIDLGDVPAARPAPARVQHVEIKSADPDRAVDDIVAASKAIAEAESPDAPKPAEDAERDTKPAKRKR